MNLPCTLTYGVWQYYEDNSFLWQKHQVEAILQHRVHRMLLLPILL